MAKHINDLIPAQPGVSAQLSPESGPRGAPRHLIAGLWSSMASMYGNKWTSSFGAAVDPDRVWSAALYGLDEAQMKRGVHECVKQGRAWPPSAPEFRILCLNGVDTWEHRQVAAADRDYANRRKLLTDACADVHSDSVAEAELAKIFNMLGIPRSDRRCGVGAVG